MNIITPNNFPEHYIYDIFYTDRNDLVIIQPAEIRPAPQIYLFSPLKNQHIDFKHHKCKHLHTYLYIIQNEILNTELGESIHSEIEIMIKYPENNEMQTHTIKTIPNRYPKYENKILMATLLKNENNIIRTWIDFHLKLGVDCMLIYDNDTEPNKLGDLLTDYLSQGQVILIKWPYKYRLEISGISSQTTQQTHSIWAFNTSRWIGLLDVDEYINI